jgi:FkbM family methyltransferase
MWKLKDFLKGKDTEKDHYGIYKSFREKERMRHFKMCFRTAFGKFWQKCHNGLYVLLFPRYSALTPLERKSGKLKIMKKGDRWLIQRQEMTLLSPTPKFVYFSFKGFEDKFERFFKIERGETVLDVGACIGDTTFPMAVKVGVDGFVIAVEPHPINIECLKLNLASFRNVEVVEKAVWNTTGVIRFNVSKTPSGHSILEHPERDRYTEVSCDTLDNIVGDRKIDFAKIDVQGAEVQVLEGGARFLRTTRKLVVEAHDQYNVKRRTFPIVIKILKESGYETRLTMGYIVHAWK